MATTFPVQGGLKQGDALLPLLFSFALEYAITNVQVNLEGLEFCGTHQLCPCAGNFSLLGRNLNTVVRQSFGLCGVVWISWESGPPRRKSLVEVTCEESSLTAKVKLLKWKCCA